VCFDIFFFFWGFFFWGSLAFYFFWGGGGAVSYKEMYLHCWLCKEFFAFK